MTATTTAIDPGRQPYGCVPNLTRIPMQLSGRGLTALFAAAAVVEPTSGEVPGGIWQIVEVLGVSYVAALEAIQDCEQFGLMKRVGLSTRTKRLFLPLLILSEESNRPCEGCGIGLQESTRGSAKWCAKCRQTIGRADRNWQLRAIAHAVDGKTPPEIAAILGQPLWGKSDEEPGAFRLGVVPYLLAEGLLGESTEQWRAALVDQVGKERAGMMIRNGGLRIGRHG